MHPEVDELKPKLKEILYDCAVEIRATKAALYLLDPGQRKFELVTDYGFRGGVRQAAGFNDPLIDRCEKGRVPFFVNSVGADPRLSELLFQGSTQRLLAVPLYSRGKLVGVIDMRDKAAQQPFEQTDVAKAQSIADRMLTLFAAKNVFNHRFITLADTEETAPQRVPVPLPVLPVHAPLSPDEIPRVESDPNDNRSAMVRATSAVAAPAPPPAIDPQQITARISGIVTKSRVAAARIAVAAYEQTPGPQQLAVARDVMRALLFLPHCVVAALTGTGAGGFQEIVSKGAMSSEALESLQSKLHSWITRRGERASLHSPNVHLPVGSAGPEVTASSLGKVFTAPVDGPYPGLYLTVAFAENPDRNTHELLAAFLAHVEIAIANATDHTSLAAMRERAAQELLEPHYSSYPELRRHSEGVAGRCERFARFLGMTPEDVESTRLTALVHDVGMRLLDYDRLYRNRNITADELAMLREHVSISAVIVEPLLGLDIAKAVLSHHERVDGGGYPNELQGSEIPLTSRLLAICDSYATMTDPGTYHATCSHEEAMAAISRGAGAQFDAELASRFAEHMASPTLG